MTVIAGRYRLLDLLAEGATGTVWRARDETLGREVAVKEVHAPPGLAPEAERLLYARIEREARAAALIGHPGIARTHDVVVERGRPWIVMELVRGLTLAETVEADGPLPPREAARVGAEVLAALRAAREAGVPHRDPGPDRVLLGNDGRTVVTGFGTATAASPAFRAPELGADADPDEAADLWALGALLRAAVGERATGPLGSLVEGLLREDPAARVPADRAERELRRIATGRGAEPGTGPGPGPGGPLPDASGRGVRGRTERNGGAGAGSPAPGRDEEPSTGGKKPPRGPRRRTVLAAGLVGVLLLAGAWTFHVLSDGKPDAGPGGGGATSTAPAEPGATVTGNAPTATPRP